MYQPMGWTPTDKEEASLDVVRFLETKGYQWIAAYVGTRQRMIGKDLCPTKPSDKTHGYFIENSARYGELEDLMAAIAAIAYYKTEKEENGEK